MSSAWGKATTTCCRSSDPSTTRDSVGRVVDFALNPLRHVVDPPEIYYLTGARALAGVGARSRFSGSIDDVLYNSEDSYTALRSLYLQNRRFQLRGEDAELFDPYSDETVAAAPEEDAYFDPYSDPYFDPTASDQSVTARTQR
jgi:phospholipid-binding lipoprotein MlaA